MWQRILAMIFKEMRQMRRDQSTVAMMVMMPIVQLTIIGFAVNGDPRNLPLVVEANDNSAFSRSIVMGLKNTGYFDITEEAGNYGAADRMVARGTAQFALTIPTDFSRRIVRGDAPQLLLTVDASDPSTTGPAVAAFGEAVNRAIAQNLPGPLAARRTGQPPVDLVIHRAYNPEGITSHNTIPALLAIILSMTLVMQTALSVTRETEQGTMENLLATPLRPIEVMIGKIVPNLLIGTVQAIVILLVARFAFVVPFAGSPWLIGAATILFMAVCLAMGFTISTFAANQAQAMQMSMFTLIPSILLSGFIFPFRGMPVWAQWIAEFLPPTHYIRLVRGILLKGWEADMVLPEIGTLMVLLCLFGAVAVWRYRDTIA